CVRWAAGATIAFDSFDVW
nr:immunoglobulin heavy chain junction region [Macaca mulatta]